MAGTFAPLLDVLPAAQRALWPELAQVPGEFVLYGGTALALHLGHRTSIDFDFFALAAIDPDALLAALPILAHARILQKAPNTLDVVVDRGGPVKLSFFGVPALRRVRPPHRSRSNGLLVASLMDLAGSKVSVVQQRSELKDYLDVAAILGDGRVDLPTALGAARAIYGERFNPQVSLKALSYFGDGDLAGLPSRSRGLLLRAVQGVDVDRLPVVTAVP